MSAFKNLLQKDDVVMHCESKRVGKVACNPMSTNVTPLVIWQGTSSPQAAHIAKLRLVVNGKPEDVAPHDGDLPSTAPQPAKRPLPLHTAAPGTSALEALRNERDGIVAAMNAMEIRFKELKLTKERMDQAIAVLSPLAPTGVHVPRMV